MTVCIAKQLGVRDEMVLHKFLLKLSTIAPVIALLKDLTPAQLSKLADKLMPLIHNATALITPENKLQ